MTLELNNPGELLLIRRILALHIPELEVWAFGSRAKGRAKPHSDLDLVLVTAQPLAPQRLAALEIAFSESDLPYRVDLVDWSCLEPGFRELIEKTHVVVQEQAR